MNAFKLYFRYIDLSFRGQMQYRMSFVMMTVGNFLGSGIEFVAILALFDRFGSLRTWSLPEVAFFYGLVNLAFSLTDAVSRGFDDMGHLVKQGEFDRLLLRPRSTVLQLIGKELTLKRIGRFVQGAVVLAWSIMNLNIDWTISSVLLAIFTILCGACFFLGLFIILGTLTFWTTESLEIMNALTYGGIETSKYPLSIYRDWFRSFFTMVIPMGCVTYFPVVAILGRSDPLGTSVTFQYISPIFGPIFFLLTLQLWRFGVRHYRSTGS